MHSKTYSVTAYGKVTAETGLNRRQAEKVANKLRSQGVAWVAICPENGPKLEADPDMSFRHGWQIVLLVAVFAIVVFCLFCGAVHLCKLSDPNARSIPCNRSDFYRLFTK